MPAAQINEHGPLPTGPYAGLDGVINGTNSLLDNIKPYAQPKSGAMGSDRNYQQIPHRMQQVVPMLFLPSADPAILEPCRVSHPVDFGDIAFSLCSNNVVALMSQNKQAVNMVRAPARNVFCNLVTVNYLLAGLQRLRSTDRNNWSDFAENMGYNFAAACDDEETKMRELLKMLAYRILPYGIVQGSEKQGGQHETTLAPVQAAVNFVVTMTVDGQNRDLVHFWRDSQISAGDQLVYVLEKRKTRKFVLNHYYKQMTTQIYPEEHVCWQLIPRVFCAAEETRYRQEPEFHDTDLYDYRYDGYWRVAQSFQHRAPMFDSRNYADDTIFLKGQLLQVTFAPTWVQMDPFTPLNKRKAVKLSGGEEAGPKKTMRDLLFTQSRTNVKLPPKTIKEHIEAKDESGGQAASTSKLLQLLGGGMTVSAQQPPAAMNTLPVLSTSSRAESSKTGAKAPAVGVAGIAQTANVQPQAVGVNQKVVETKVEAASDTVPVVASSKKIKVVKR